MHTKSIDQGVQGPLDWLPLGGREGTISSAVLFSQCTCTIVVYIIDMHGRCWY